MRELETSVGPVEVLAKATLQREMTFSYRQAIGELLFPAITCRPDILYRIIKLSQYNNKPVKIHYITVKRVFKYLRDTINDELHFWRPNVQSSLPPSHALLYHPITTTSTFLLQRENPHMYSSILIGQATRHIVVQSQAWGYSSLAPQSCIGLDSNLRFLPALQKQSS